MKTPTIIKNMLFVALMVSINNIFAVTTVKMYFLNKKDQPNQYTWLFSVTDPQNSHGPHLEATKKSILQLSKKTKSQLNSPITADHLIEISKNNEAAEQAIKKYIVLREKTFEDEYNSIAKENDFELLHLSVEDFFNNCESDEDTETDYDSDSDNNDETDNELDEKFSVEDMREIQQLEWHQKVIIEFCEDNNIVGLKNTFEKFNKDFNINFYHNGQTLLHIATIKGYLEMAQYLIERGALVEETDLKNEEKIFLHHLCNQKSENTEKILVLIKTAIAQQANIDVEDKTGNTPLYYALMNDQITTAEFLINNGACIYNTCIIKEPYARGQLILQFCKNDDLANLEELLKKLENKNFDINFYYDDQTPLHIATLHGHLEIAKYLLTHGALAEKADLKHAGKNFLHHLCNQKYTQETAEKILDLIKIAFCEKHANIDLKDNDDKTPLYYALINDQYLTAKLLITYGACIYDACIKKTDANKQYKTYFSKKLGGKYTRNYSIKEMDYIVTKILNEENSNKLVLANMKYFDYKKLKHELKSFIPGLPLCPPYTLLLFAAKLLKKSTKPLYKDITVVVKKMIALLLSHCHFNHQFFERTIFKDLIDFAFYHQLTDVKGLDITTAAELLGKENAVRKLGGKKRYNNMKNLQYVQNILKSKSSTPKERNFDQIITNLTEYMGLKQNETIKTKTNRPHKNCKIKNYNFSKEETELEIKKTSSEPFPFFFPMFEGKIFKPFNDNETNGASVLPLNNPKQNTHSDNAAYKAQTRCIFDNDSQKQNIINSQKEKEDAKNLRGAKNSKTNLPLVHAPYILKTGEKPCKGYEEEYYPVCDKMSMPSPEEFSSSMPSNTSSFKNRYNNNNNPEKTPKNYFETLAPGYTLQPKELPSQIPCKKEESPKKLTIDEIIYRITILRIPPKKLLQQRLCSMADILKAMKIIENRK